MKTPTIIDIETAPLSDVKARIAELFPFDPEEVKCGNLKDPLKIEEKIREARENHESKLEDRAALNPLLGRVCAVGIVDTDGGYTLLSQMSLDPCKDEAEMIGILWNTLGSIATYAPTVAGWNLHGFDLPFLVKRSWLLGIKVPSHIRKGRYWNDSFIDLMKEFTFHGHMEFFSLAKAAKLFGVAQPREHGIEGKDFWKVLNTDPEKALQYLRDDLTETQAIAKIIL